MLSSLAVSNALLGLILLDARAIIEFPETISRIINNDLVKFLSVVMASYHHVGNIKTSILITVLFFIIIYLFRTREERARHPRFV